MGLNNSATVQGDQESYLSVTFNHHNYDEPERAVFVSLGSKPAYFLNDYEVISVEQAKELRAKLDEIIEEFEANKPSLADKALEVLNGLGTGSIVQFGPRAGSESWGRWVKRTQTVWEVIDSNSVNHTFIGSKRDVADFFKHTQPYELPNVIFNSTEEAL